MATEQAKKKLLVKTKTAPAQKKSQCTCSGPTHCPTCPKFKKKKKFVTQQWSFWFAVCQSSPVPMETRGLAATAFRPPSTFHTYPPAAISKFGLYGLHTLYCSGIIILAYFWWLDFAIFRLFPCCCFCLPLLSYSLFFFISLWERSWGNGLMGKHR